MTMPINILFRCYYLSDGTQGSHIPLFTKRAFVELADGYLDDTDWQKAVLDLCHSLHLWQGAKWDVIPHFEIYVGSVRVQSFSHGGLFVKAPSVPHLVMNVTMELLRQAEAESLRPRVEPSK